METPGSLVDKISIVNMKIFHWIEESNKAEKGDEYVAESYRKVHSLNSQRSNLVREFDLLIKELLEGKKLTVYESEKTYGNK